MRRGSVRASPRTALVGLRAVRATCSGRAQERTRGMTVTAPSSYDLGSQHVEDMMEQGGAIRARRTRDRQRPAIADSEGSAVAAGVVAARPSAPGPGRSADIAVGWRGQLGRAVKGSRQQKTAASRPRGRSDGRGDMSQWVGSRDSALIREVRRRLRARPVEHERGFPIDQSRLTMAERWRRLAAR